MTIIIFSLVLLLVSTSVVVEVGASAGGGQEVHHDDGCTSKGVAGSEGRCRAGKATGGARSFSSSAKQWSESKEEEGNHPQASSLEDLAALAVLSPSADAYVKWARAALALGRTEEAEDILLNRMPARYTSSHM